MNSDLATFIDTLPYTVTEEQLVREGVGRGERMVGSSRDQRSRRYCCCRCSDLMWHKHFCSNYAAIPLAPTPSSFALLFLFPSSSPHSCCCYCSYCCYCCYQDINISIAIGSELLVKLLSIELLNN